MALSVQLGSSPIDSCSSRHSTCAGIVVCSDAIKAIRAHESARDFTERARKSRGRSRAHQSFLTRLMSMSRRRVARLCDNATVEGMVRPKSGSSDGSHTPCR